MNLPTPANIEEPGVTATQMLMRKLIDYAGLFPPAALTMAESVANYDAYSRSGWNWILGRFIVPVARLGELEQALATRQNSATAGNLASWRFSVVLGSNPAQDLVRVREFNERMAKGSAGGLGGIESVEVKVQDASEVKEISRISPPQLQVYFEFPFSRCEQFIREISVGRQRAKIRTGGETADKVPSCEEVVEFMRLCAANNVAFKATAGLHHPIHSVHHFTYEPESASGMMHGFLNLFLAAAFLRTGMRNDEATRLLEEQSPDAFRVEAGEVSWRERRLSSAQIGAARRDFAISFGSCSFTEPIEDLQSLNIL
jgi:hypothetical protein